MDFYVLYTLFKYVHVLAAIAWIGGGVTLCFLSILAVRANDEAGMLWVPVTGGMVRLSIDTILRVEAARDYVYLHTAERAFLLRGTMQQFDRRLTGSGLIRVHRSAMVRASAVDQIIRSGKTAYLQMTDGQRVPVGPSYRAALFAALGHSGSP